MAAMGHAFASITVIDPLASFTWLRPSVQQDHTAPVVRVRPQPKLPVRVQPPPAGLRQQHATPTTLITAFGWCSICPSICVPVARSPQ